MEIGSNRSVVLLALGVLWVVAFGAVAVLKTFGSGRALRRYGVFAALWLGATLWIGWTEIGAVFDSMPPRPLFFLVPIFVFTTLLVYSSIGTRIVEAMSIRGLVFFQAFRIVVELMLWSLWDDGVSNQVLTFEGRNFDIASGIVALVLGALYGRFRQPRWLIWCFNIGGLLLLLHIVVVAILTMPTPFRVFTDGPANVLVAKAPYIWLPTVLVCAAYVGHLLLTRKLMSRSA